MLRRILTRGNRRGSVTPLAAILMIFLLAAVAFAVDIGYILLVKNEAQNAADSAALAGMTKLAERLKAAPIVNGIPVQTQADIDLARQEARTFASRNRIGSQDGDLRDTDIEIGYLADPYTHSSTTLDTSGWPARPYNAVRVIARRDQNHTGGPLQLFFGKALGMGQRDIDATATAAYAMGTVRPMGNQNGRRGGLLPFTYQMDEWNALLAATSAGSVTAANGATVILTDVYTVNPTSTSSGGVLNGPDTRLETTLFPDLVTSGNFGTINFTVTKSSNSTSVLRNLIENGPDTADWPDLAAIAQASAANPVSVNGDPGLSAGMESAVKGVIGQPRILSLYSTVSGTGNNTFYQIVGFTPITIVDVNLHGGTKYIKIQPRVVGAGNLIDGTHRLSFSITPSSSPNPLFLGNRLLVR